MSQEAFIENGRFYIMIDYNLDYEDNIYDYVEMEAYIEKDIICCLETKFSGDLFYAISSSQYTYDHIRIVSLDYPPKYAINEFNLIESLRENFIILITNPFSYVIFAELVALIALVTFLRKKGAF